MCNKCHAYMSSPCPHCEGEAEVSKVMIGRPAGETTLNGLEFVLDDDGEVMLFDSEEDAIDFLKDFGLEEDEINALHFVEEVQHESRSL